MRLRNPQIRASLLRRGLRKARQPAAAPNPVSFNWINNRADNRAVNAVSRKLCSFRHGAGNDCSCGGAENKIKYEAVPVVCIKIREQTHCGQSEESAQSVLTEQQSASQKNKYHGAYAEIHKILHNDVAGVFCPCKTGFNHCKARLHKEHQRGSHKEPDACRPVDVRHQFFHNSSSLKVKGAGRKTQPTPLW